MDTRAGDPSRVLRSGTALPLYLRYGLLGLAALLAVAVWREPQWSLLIPAPTAAFALLLLSGAAAVFALTHLRLRQSAAASARNEESLRLAQTYANEAAWDFDPRTGALRWTLELDRLYGVAEGSITSYEAWRRLVYPDDVQRVDAELTKALATREPFDVEFRILDGSGELRWICTRGTAVCNESGEVVRVLGMSFDITGRKRAEEALRQSEARFHTLADTVPLLWWEANADGWVTWCNQRTYDYTGTSPGDLDGWGWQSICDPAMLPQVLERWRASLAREQPFEMVIRLRGADGSSRPFLARAAAVRDPAGAVIRWVATGTDIGDEIRTQEALRKALEQRQMALTAAGLGAWEWLGPRSKVVCDERCALLLGFPARAPVELETSELIARVHPDDRDPTLKILRQAMAGVREGEYRSEFRILWPNGSWHWVALQGQAFSEGEPRRPVRLAGVVMDIAERKQAEEALREAQRMEGIALLAAGVGHEFNNILTAVMGNIALAQSQVDPASEIRANLEVAIGCCERAAGLTRQLLAYAGKTAFIREPVSIFEVAQGVVQLMRASQPVEIRAELAPDLPLVLAEPVQIRQALVELVLNGCEAIEPGQPGIVTVRTSLRGDHVCIEVSDTGRGMDRETTQRIFDPFFTTKFLGRGMGLPSVRGIVQAFHGRIAVESEPGKGTRFEVLLPSMEAPLAAPAPDRWVEPAAVSGTVLIVDDEAPIRRMAAALLGNLGVTVLEASTGREAIARLQEDPGVDMMLLDMVMPDLGGAEALPEIQRLRPDMPIIVSSGYAETEVKRRFGDRDFANFLPKPYTGRQLLECVLPVLARAGNTRRRSGS